jgi:hypothetical protein
MSGERGRWRRAYALRSLALPHYFREAFPCQKEERRVKYIVTYVE